MQNNPCRNKKVDGWKRGFETEHEAHDHLVALRAKGIIEKDKGSTYKCPLCGAHHVSSGNKRGRNINSMDATVEFWEKRLGIDKEI